MHVWGGRAWTRLVDTALMEMGDLTGKRVLELGFHDGTMSREFARRGAQVTALEVRDVAVAPCAGVTFRRYSGDLDEIGGAFDVVFTKSVLVLTDLATMLPAICRKLAPGGRVVFIENGAGHPLVSWLRYVLRPPRVWRGVRYLDGRAVRLIGSHFDGFEVRRTHCPPVYLMLARAPHASVPRVTHAETFPSLLPGGRERGAECILRERDIASRLES